MDSAFVISFNCNALSVVFVSEKSFRLCFFASRTTGGLIAVSFRYAYFAYLYCILHNWLNTLCVSKYTPTLNSDNNVKQ